MTNRSNAKRQRIVGDLQAYRRLLREAVDYRRQDFEQTGVVEVTQLFLFFKEWRARVTAALTGDGLS